MGRTPGNSLAMPGVFVYVEAPMVPYQKKTGPAARKTDRPARPGGPRASGPRPPGPGSRPAGSRPPAPRAPRPERPADSGINASGEMKYHGYNACEALWKNRAIDIIRVYVDESRVADFGALLKWCARQKKAYHVCTPADLEKIAATVHHEGIVILAHAPKPLGDDEFEARLASFAGPTALVYLDGVQNPHNVGSITRLAAHFGVPLIIGKDKELPRLSPSAARVAEGAAEHVPLCVLKDPDLAFSKLKKKGYKVIVTSSHAKTSLYAAKLPEKVLFVFGGESAGASARVTKLADLEVNVPGTGQVESLNVAVAAGLFLGEFWRAHKSK